MQILQIFVTDRNFAMKEHSPSAFVNTWLESYHYVLDYWLPANSRETQSSKASRQWNVIPPVYSLLCPADHETAKPGNCRCWQESVLGPSSHLLAQGDSPDILVHPHQLNFRGCISTYSCISTSTQFQDFCLLLLSVHGPKVQVLY